MRAALIVLALAALGAGCYGLTLINWGAVARSASCPEGQHMAVAYYMPIMVGKVMTMTPVYQCEAAS